MSYRYQYWEDRIRLVDTQIDSILDNRDMELAALRAAKMAPRPVKRAAVSKKRQDLELLSLLSKMTPEKMEKLKVLFKQVKE